MTTLQRTKPTAQAGPKKLRAVDAAELLPHKSFECEVKAGESEGEIVLYAAVFGNVDRQGDVIQKGAFDNLESFVRDGWGAINHRGMDLPIAYVVEARQDEKGLWIRAKFHSTTQAQDARTVVLERMAAGKRVLCSIGYLTRSESFERINGRQVRRINGLSVYEWSIVNLPANDEADAQSAKGATMPVETKRAVAISAANHKKMSEFSEEMDGHHERMTKCYGTMKKCMKEMGDCHKAMQDTHDEYKNFLKGHEPGATRGEGDDVEDNDDKSLTDTDDDEDEADTDDANPPKKRKKVEKPTEKTLDRHEIAAKLAALSRP